MKSTFRVIFFALISLVGHTFAQGPVSGTAISRSTTLGNQWWVYITGTNSTATNYAASNPRTGQRLASTDCSTLLTLVSSNVGDGGRITIDSSPYFQAAYVFNSTVVITNWIVIQGAGNPSTTMRAGSVLNGPMFLVGDDNVAVGGINRFIDLRFEGSAAGANTEGIRFYKCAEPVVDTCEFNGFKRSGITFTNLGGNHWSYVVSSWFVVDTGGSGILINATPPDPFATELYLNNNFFGIGSGSGIEVSNHFNNISIIGNRFRWMNPFAAVVGIRLRAGNFFNIANNKFQDWPTDPSPIYFQDRSAPTNYASIVIGNLATRWGGSPATTNVVYVGTNVQGVLSVGNHTPAGTASFYASTNGPVFQFDTSGLRVGNSNQLAITNILTLTNVIDFASQNLGGLEDQPIACPPCATGDVVEIGVPNATIGSMIGTFSGYASNGMAYVRFVSNAAAQNPPSGTFKVIVKKF
jgi:hypothetical protein